MTGKQFAQQRHQLGLSQRDLADALGFNHSTIAKWELRAEVPRFAHTAIEMYATLAHIRDAAGGLVR